jgi:intracellular multiplication protein IcmP
MAGEGGNSNDGLWMVFFILVMITLLLWGIWTVFKPQLLQTYIWVRQGQAEIASLWTDDDHVIQTSAGTISFGESKELLGTLTPEIMLQDDVKHWEVMATTSLATLKPLRVPIGIIFVMMGIYAVFLSPRTKHRKSYNLETLIKTQSKTFPVVSPFITFNPSDGPSRPPGALVPAELPLFAEALSPEEWTAYHKIPIQDSNIDKEAMEKAMNIQLFEKWQGYKKLPPYLQILLAGFALKSVRKRTESDDLLGELALCWNHKKGLSLNSALISKARKILKSKDISGEIIAQCNRHAYITTALLGALEHTRSEGGVLAPAQFVWLRGHNRTLWYPLNNLGKKTFHAEAIGAMSHYRAEQHIKRPIPKPMTKDAVDVTIAYLQDNEKSMPIPQLDFSMIKNKKAPKKNQGIMKPTGT